MKIEGIIFDLDQTLVDSSSLETLRTNRKWNQVLQSLNLISFNPVFTEFFEKCKINEVRIGIITNSPSNYAKAVLNHFRLQYNQLVAYHDVTFRKPHPEPFLKMLSLLNLDFNKCISVGDHDNDIIASHEANIKAIGAKWYTPNYKFNSNPDFISNKIEDLFKIINQ